MKTILSKILHFQNLIGKAFLLIISTLLIVYLLPKEHQFSFDYKMGMPWQHEDLYAPFDFSLPKSKEKISAEKKRIEKSSPLFYAIDSLVFDSIRTIAVSKLQRIESGNKKKQIRTKINELDSLYAKGIIAEQKIENQSKTIFLEKNNRIINQDYSHFLTIQDVKQFVIKSGLDTLFPILPPNTFFDDQLTLRYKQQQLDQISLWEGFVEKGKLIISSNEPVSEDSFKILEALKFNYTYQQAEFRSNYLIGGYAVLVFILLVMLFLFIRKYRKEIYEDNRKVLFILLNMILAVLAVATIINRAPDYLYIVPLCLLPLLIKAFFDPRLGLFTHVVTILIISLVVPDSSIFIIVQIIAGIVTILTVSESYKRTNLFLSVGRITLVYIVSYYAVQMIYQGNTYGLSWLTIGNFVINGLIILALSVPLFYIYEKLFGLVSDFSLLELSDTNSPLLKELADTAPGTFHHSLQVANLAEAAAQEIGANAMLVRVGALYHDIGKMKNPSYFTENQTSGSNLHDELSNIESARIIISHVKDGIALAKTNKIPDRIIDFIRTHHGTMLVYYFYSKEKESAEIVDEDLFRYPGPIPFSKETAILMMSDSVEAASKSLKEPDAIIIDAFVEKIIEKQIEEKQFLNSDITLKEIEKVKKVLKRKLINIYHLRIEYPE
ncbi:MAG: HDIG domain-containing protein [Flavobacteriaceae bacterium]|nr:HDIG domain-containing protein [Flavobacteriaceae bacterium]MDZ4147186.1 HDIG domain-containing protein [Flavobacteriaceae bacterium]